MERIKDYLLMEEEFIQNQERLKPQEEKQEVSVLLAWFSIKQRVTEKDRNFNRMATRVEGSFFLILLKYF